MKVVAGIINFFHAMWFVFLVRIGWHQMRREAGYPISWKRALFGKYPRFGAYEEDEAGCSEYNKQYYEMVRDAKDL